MAVRIPACVFAKPPLPGRVKSRIARVLGEECAAQLASAMLCDVWATIQSVRELIPVLAAAEPGVFPLAVDATHLWYQAEGDLGARIESIFRRALRKTPAAFAIGADSPLLMAAHLREALDALSGADAVIGPCTDGGFYLLGVHRCPPQLLKDVAWSCESTCRETQARLRAQGMVVAVISELPDIDTVADIAQLQNNLLSTKSHVAIHTRKWLRENSWLASLSRR